MTRLMNISLHAWVTLALGGYVVLDLLRAHAEDGPPRQLQSRAPRHSPSPSRAPSIRSLSPTERCEAGADTFPSFWQVALAAGKTDKVPQPPEVPLPGGSAHHYHHAYEKHMWPLHCKPVSLLEIGLGCNEGAAGMPVGPGQSVPIWLSYLPFGKITVMEYDATCAANFVKSDPLHIGPRLAQRVSVVSGDQSSEDDLRAVIEAARREGGSGRSGFDVIVDDGGHSMKQQITSLRVLFREALAPGGLYFLEDLQTSFFTDISAFNDFHTSAVAYIAELISCLHLPNRLDSLDDGRFPGLRELVPLVKSVDCSAEMCVLTKWADGEKDAPLPTPASAAAMEGF